MSKRSSFYRNLNLKRCMVMSMPFWAAAIASQGLSAQQTINVSTESQLRAAIDSVNASTTNDTIILAAGTYNLTAGSLENANATGDYDIDKSQGDLTIRGAGASSTIIDANSLDRIFHIDTNGSLTITIEDLTLRDGDGEDNGQNFNAGWGGAILNRRTGGATNTNLTLRNVTVDNCLASGSSGSSGSPGQSGNDAFGGAIYSEGGTITIENSTLSGNDARGGTGGAGSSAGDNGGDGGDAFGGAIFIAGGNLNISGSNFTNNRAWGGDGGTGSDGSSSAPQGGNGGDGGGGFGGAIYVDGATVSISANSNFTINKAWGGAGNDGGEGSAPSSGGGRQGGHSGFGGDGHGGAIFVNAGNVTLTSVNVTGNDALGGDAGLFAGDGGSASSGAGGDGGLGRDGGEGAGGGLYVDNGNIDVVVSECSISGNFATGGVGSWGGDGGDAFTFGAGRVGGNGGNAGAGGPARGAGFYIGSSGVDVQVTDSTISGNVASGGEGGRAGTGGSGSSARGGHGGDGGDGGAALGGGYYRLGGSVTLNITNSTISGNSVVGGDGGIAGNAGNSTVSGNGGDGGDAGQSSGGGVFLDNGTLNLNNSTVAGNTATAATAAAAGAGSPTGQAGAAVQSTGGGAHREGGTLNAFSTIFADNTADAGADFSGNVTASASLFEDATGANITAGAVANVTGQDPQLSPLGNNGGATQTHAISTGSPARNAGDNPLSLTTDQRGTGFARDDGNGVDIGAFEEQTAAGVTPQPTITNPQTATEINAATFNVQGTAPADSLVQIYSDANNDGLINGTDSVVGQQQLTGGATNFSISVSLTQDAANDFTATAEDAPSTESPPVDIVRLTEDSTPPAGPVVTDPVSAISTSGVSYDIQGTAEAGSLVDIYSDINNNGSVDGADAIVGSQQLAAGGANFSITVALTQGAANDFTVRATDAAGNVSVETDVPTITETSSSAISPPTISDPMGPTLVSASSYTIMGTSQADSLVRIYRDLNNDGAIGAGDVVVAQQQLTGGGTAFAISAPLIAGTANNFVATAEDAGANESAATNVPTITEGATSSSGGGGGGGGGGGCVAEAESSGWGLLGGLLAIMAALKTVFRRREEA